jgi:hypothetical protein
MCRDAMKNYRQLVFTGALGALSIDRSRGIGRNYTSELVTDLAGATSRATGRYDDEYGKIDGAGCSSVARSICCIRRRLSASPIAAVSDRDSRCRRGQLVRPGTSAIGPDSPYIGVPGRVQSRGRA